MREIKFRAWDGDAMLFRGVCDRNWYNASDKLVDVALPEDAHDMKLMQYTGLKDKNCVEIYEGDIVNIGFRDGSPEKWIYEPGVIRWWMPSAAFKWFSIKEDPSDANNYWLQQAYSGTREVIGNIYENPELLNET